jgi:hypothetical protein
MGTGEGDRHYTGGTMKEHNKDIFLESLLKKETLPLTKIKPIIFLHDGTPYRVITTGVTDGQTFVGGIELTMLQASRLVAIIAPTEQDAKAKGYGLKAYDTSRQAFRNVFFICSRCYQTGNFNFAVIDRAIGKTDPNTYVCLGCNEDF